MALTLKYATPAQLGAAFRERYRDSSGMETARLARWLVRRIQDGTFTATQVRNFFGLTQPQWDTLRAKMEDWQTKLDSIEAAGGE